MQAFDVSAAPDRRSLGSAVTTSRGFEISYEDVVKDQGVPTDVQLIVSAPEEPGRQLNAAILFESEVRHRAAKNETFVVQIDSAALANKEVALPEAEDVSDDDPVLIKNKLDSKIYRAREIRKAIYDFARAEVDAARQNEFDMDQRLRGPVLQSLTGLSPNSPAWNRFVAPGADAQQIARERQQDALSLVINQDGGVETYLVLAPDEYQALYDVNGQANPERVEARLRRDSESPWVMRDDPLLRECRTRRLENPFDPPAPVEPNPPDPPAPVEPRTINEHVAALLENIYTPERVTIAEDVRADQEAVGRVIGNLSLHRGPADVPALYDFHNLQIAFDHVWEDARAEGVLEVAKSMYRTALEAGGDPATVMQGSTRPLHDLAQEVALVARTRIDGPLGDTIGDFGDWLPPVPPPVGPHPSADLGDVRADTVDYDHGTSEGYPFAVFAAGTVNFGLLVTYRQRWEPLSYQVGRLAKTLTLAPKESLSFTTRQVIKTSMSQKQMNANQSMRKQDADDTRRDEAEIIERADSKTNFSMSSSGGFDLGPLGEGDSTTNFGKDVASGSQETKRAFREAVRRASQEYRDERKVEVETSISVETETTEKREISNPNDELPLTYLFYELQRRYRVSEKLHRLTPVVLVAQKVPAPGAINEAWLLRYDWIVRRFLLDDSFQPALEYVVSRMHGDRIILGELKRNVDDLRAAVSQLKDQLVEVRRQIGARYEALEASIARQAAIAEEEDSEGYVEKGWESLAWSSDESEEAARIREDAARDAYERAAREEQDVRARLEREVTALQLATDSYVKAQATHANHQAQISRLLQHIRDNILYYMQGIWSYEPPDQRFFRHHTIEAPRLLPNFKVYTLELMDEWPVGVTPVAGKQCYRVTLVLQVDADLTSAEKRGTLAELAELDKPLGFKGNYIMFPLKKSNALTDYMMTPYLDEVMGLRDPDALGNWTLDEFSDYVACLREELGEQFAEVEADLRAQYQILLSDPSRDGEEIVVPTSSLYMEALVAGQTIMEDFKLLHRGVDVLKARADARYGEMENLRLGARILGGQLDDPKIDKKVVIEGNTPVSIDTDM